MYANIDTILSENLKISFDQIFNKQKLKQVFFPYEAQPWQDTLSTFIKNKFSNIKSVGYLHSSQMLYLLIIYIDMELQIN